jgi:glucose 1-dehydrogenase
LFNQEEFMSKESKRLDGMKALVTGSGTGIGQEIALEYARQGADVVLHYFNSGNGAKDAVSKIIASGGKASTALF